MVAAPSAVVDALDETQVEEHADAIAKDGGLDISMNVITHPHTHGTPLWEMDADDYMALVEVAARTTSITARGGAPDDPAQVGVILAFRRTW